MTAPPAAPDRPGAFTRHGWLWAAVALTLLKLALVRAQPVLALGQAIHDDKLFIELAAHLVRGEWLGPYTEMTLAKGPLYSLFLAANFHLGLPLGLTQQLLYVGACALAVAALAPRLGSGWGRLLVYAGLLWNPLTYEGASLTRILRQHLTVPLGLVIAACLIALALRGREPFRRRAGWAAGLGLALGGFWLTREESIWILPLVGLGGAAVLFLAWRDGPSARRAAAWLGALAVSGFVLPHLVISWQNLRHYGWFGTVEFRAAAFEDAYGALTRVQVGPALPQVPLPPEARAAIYAVSPAFARLQPWLEGPVGDHWADAERFDRAERQLLGGWFVWALRDAVRQAGLAPDPAAALRYYRQLADEVNRACDDGRLPARGRRSGFAPVWHPTYTADLLAAGPAYFRTALTLPGFTAHTPPSIGTNDDVRPFRDLTHNLISPSPDALHIVLPVSESLAGAKLHWLGEIGRRFAAGFTYVLLGTLLLAGVRGLQLALQRRCTVLFWLGLAVWAGAVAGVGINLVVHVAAFPNIAPAAYAPAYPLFLLGTILVLADARAALRDRDRGSWAALAALVPFTRTHAGGRIVAWGLVAVVAGGWFLTRPLPFTFDPEIRWRTLLLPPTAVRDLSYTFASPAAEDYPAARLVGAAQLLPVPLRNEFRGTHISGPADTCTIQSAPFPVTAPWLVVPVAGFPVSRGNAVLLRVIGTDGSVRTELAYDRGNPDGVGFWLIDLSRHAGTQAQLVLRDGRTDASGWVAAGPPQPAAASTAARRVAAGWRASHQAGLRRTLGGLALVTGLLALAELGVLMARRRRS